MYGLVFKDDDDNSLNVAIFDDVGETFTEVYELDEEYSSLFEQLEYTSMSFVTIDISHSPMAKLEYLMTFDCAGMQSRDLIVDCYDERYPELIGDIYDRCTEPDIFDS